MYELMEKILINQTFEEQKIFSYSNKRKHPYRRRYSTLTGYDLTKYDQTTSDFPRKNSHPVQRRSTIQRLNSSNSQDLNQNRLQSNDYTSITDG